MSERITAGGEAGAPEPEGRYAYDGLDRVLHEKARLGIMTSLTTHAGGLSFNDLKALCALTDGNLSRHLQVLIDASFVEAIRGVARKRPQTLYRLSDTGRKRFHAYLDELERVIRDALARRARSQAKPEAIRELPVGWVTS